MKWLQQNSWSTFAIVQHWDKFCVRYHVCEETIEKYTGMYCFANQPDVADIRGWFRLYIEQAMFLIFHIVFPQFFYLSGFFFYGHWRLTGQQGKRGGHLFFHFTTSTCSRTFRLFFVTLHVKRLLHMFNCNPRIYYSMRFTTLSSYCLIDWWCDPVDTRRRFNVYKTSIRCRRHRMDVL